jgi:hypothetical protein
MRGMKLADVAFEQLRLWVIVSIGLRRVFVQFIRPSSDESVSLKGERKSPHSRKQGRYRSRHLIAVPVVILPLKTKTRSIRNAEREAIFRGLQFTLHRQEHLLNMFGGIVIITAIRQVADQAQLFYGFGNTSFGEPLEAMRFLFVRQESPIQFISSYQD